MTARPAPTALRQLALDYATGQLGRGDYLAARRHLLDALQDNAAGNTRADNDAAPPSVGCDGTPIAARAPASLSPADAPATRPVLPRPLLLTAAVGALVLLGGGGYALLSGQPEPAAPATVTATAPAADHPGPAVVSTPTPAAVTAPTPAPPIATAAGSVDLIDQLLQGQRLWDASERRRFLRAWEAQTPSARAAAREHPAFLRLSAELALLIDTERAGGADELVEELLAFAATIDDGSTGAALARVGPTAPDPAAAALARSAATTRDAGPPVTTAEALTRSAPGRSSAASPGPAPHANAGIAASTNPESPKQATPASLASADQASTTPPVEPTGSAPASARDAHTGTQTSTTPGTSEAASHPQPPPTAPTPTPQVAATDAADATARPAPLPVPPTAPDLRTPAPIQAPVAAGGIPATPDASAAATNERAPTGATAVGPESVQLEPVQLEPAQQEPVQPEPVQQTETAPADTPPTISPEDPPAATPGLPEPGEAPVVIPRPEPAPQSAAGVATRLPRSATADPCTRNVIAQADRGPSIPCQDQFGAGSTSRLELRGIPAAVPFAITEKTHNVTQWCRKNDALCQGDADEVAASEAYSRWISQKTGRVYSPATADQLRQAAVYDPQLGQVDRDTIRLVRPLAVTGGDAEAKLLDFWWRRFHRR